jgi:hydrogenase nickel incorporation protein HypA/HybF
MHELSITQSVVETVAERIDGRVTGVRLEIGRMSGVLPDSVRFCFDLVCEGTSLQGAWLEIVEPRALVECHTCGDRSEPDDVLAICPCGSPDVTVLAGRELRITGVEVA